MFAYFLLALVAAVLALLTYASTRFDESRVERRLHIAVPAEQLWPLVDQAKFALQPTPDGATEVSWHIHGQARFMSKLVGVFMDMDKMVDRDFEDGLQNLRQIAEGRAS